MLREDEEHLHVSFTLEAHRPVRLGGRYLGKHVRAVLETASLDENRHAACVIPSKALRGRDQITRNQQRSTNGPFRTCTQAL